MIVINNVAARIGIFALVLIYKLNLGERMMEHAPKVISNIVVMFFS